MQPTLRIMKRIKIKTRFIYYIWSRIMKRLNLKKLCFIYIIFNLKKINISLVVQFIDDTLVKH